MGSRIWEAFDPNPVTYLVTCHAGPLNSVYLWDYSSGPERYRLTVACRSGDIAEANASQVVKLDSTTYNAIELLEKATTLRAIDIGGVNVPLNTNTSTGDTSTIDAIVSEFQPWVLESYTYALIIGLSMGWAGSFLYRRFRG